MSSRDSVRAPRTETIEVQILDTVLGLSITPTTIGWVLTDGEAVDGTILARDEFRVGRHSGGVGAADISAQAAAAVLKLRATVQAHDQRLRGVGVTWSADAAVEAALLLESLTESGVDNVVPVRFQQAAGALTDRMHVIDGADRVAVCVVGPTLVTVLRYDGDADAAPEQHAAHDDDSLVEWLETLFGLGDRPGALVIAGSHDGLDGLAARLRTRLALPVVAVADAQLALARSAAAALQPGARLAEPDRVSPAGPGTEGVDRLDARMLSYTGAMAMLVVGVLAFVISVSIALSLQLTSSSGSQPPRQVAEAVKTAPVAQTLAPVVAPPPAPAREPSTEANAGPEATAFGSMWEAPPGEGGVGAPATVSQPGMGRSLLSRVLDRISGLRGR